MNTRYYARKGQKSVTEDRFKYLTDFGNLSGIAGRLGSSPNVLKQAAGGRLVAANRSRVKHRVLMNF
jgi:hypothetical protein